VDGHVLYLLEKYKGERECIIFDDGQDASVSEHLESVDDAAIIPKKEKSEPIIIID
jgi:hypothetical protein